MYVRGETVLVLGLESEQRSHYDWMGDKNRNVKHYGDTEGVSFELRDSKNERSEATFHDDSRGAEGM